MAAADEQVGDTCARVGSGAWAGETLGSDGDMDGYWDPQFETIRPQEEMWSCFLIQRIVRRRQSFAMRWDLRSVNAEGN